MRAQSLLVEVVAEDAEREDGDGKDVATEACVAAREFGEELVVVFWEMLEWRFGNCGACGEDDGGDGPWRATMLGGVSYGMAELDG